MVKNAGFLLLQVNDALFPIGGYSHSYGLETYIQKGIVKDVRSAAEFIHKRITWRWSLRMILQNFSFRKSFLVAVQPAERLLAIACTIIRFASEKKEI